ncbi:MAG: hypothetical protein ACK4SL_04055 [Candidatus Paceibacteria bacterium]
MFFGLFFEYTRWHYSRALISYVRILKNFWWFTVAYFSMPLLFKTLFVPYKRMTETPERTISSWLEAQVINTLSRLVGFCVRLFLLACGFLALCFLTIGGILGYAVWLIAPILSTLLATYGGLLIIANLF